MAQQETVNLLVDVQVEADKAIQNQKDLIYQLAIAKKELAELKESSGMMSDAYIQQEATVKQLSQQLSANGRVLTALADNTSTASGAYAILNKEAADAARAAKDLSVAYGVNDERTKAAVANAKALSDQLKEVDNSVGQNQRNVGNYPQVFDLSNTSMGRFQTMLQGFGGTAQTVGGVASNAFTGMKTQAVAMGRAFLTPPIGIIVLVLGAIMLAAQKLSAAFKKNDEASTKLEQAFAQFKPIAEGIAWVFDKIAVIAANLIYGLSKMATAVLNLIPAYKKSAEAAEKLVLAQDRLEETDRKYVVNSAERNKEIARLKKEAVNTQKYTDKQIEDMLKKADDLALKNFEEDKARKAEALRLLEEKAAQEKNTNDKTADAVAAARAAMFQAEEAYYSETMRLASKANAAAERMEAERIAKEKEQAEKAEQMRKEAREKRKESQAKEIKDMEISFALMKEKNILTSQQIYDEEKKILDKKLKYGLISRNEFLLAEIQLKKDQVTKEKEIAYKAAEAAISALDYELKMTKLKQEERLAGQKLTDEQMHAQKLADSEAAYQAEQAALKIQLENKQITQAEYDAAEKLALQQKNTDKAVIDAEYEALRQENKKIAAATDLQNELAIAEAKGQLLYELKLQQLEAEYQAELAAAEKTGANKLLIEEKYTEAKKKLAQEETAAKMDMASGFANNIAEIFGKQTKVGKLAASAAIAIDTAKGAMAAFTSTASIPVVGTALGIAAAGAVIAKGARSIKDVWAVKSGLPGDDGGGGANVPTSAAGSVASVTGSVVARQSGSTQQVATTTAMTEAMKAAPTTAVLVTNDLTTALDNRVQLKNDNSL